MPSICTTWNPADKHADITLSGGNLTATNVNQWRSVRAILSKASGKHYYEVLIIDNTYMNVGLGTSAATLSNYPGWDAYGVGMSGHVGFYAGATFTANGKSEIDYSNGDTVLIAVDFDAGKLWFGVNGVWCGSGNPAAGTDWTYSFTPGTALFPMVGIQTASCTALFGATSFAYTVPSGFNSGWYEATVSIDVDLSDTASSADAISAEQFASRSLTEDATSSDFIDATMDILDEQATVSDFIDTTMDILDEGASANDSFGTAGSTFHVDTFEEASAQDSIEGYRAIDVTVNDTLGITEAVTDGLFYAITNTDELGLTETIAYAVVYNESLIDVIFIYDDPKVGWKISVTDALVLTDTINSTLGIMIEEWLTLVDSVTNNWTGSEVISDEVNLFDVLVAGLMQTASITESLVLTDTTALKLTITVLEYLGFTDLASAMKTMAQSVSDSVALTDENQWTWPQAITEALTLIDTTSVMATFLRSISDSVAFADVPSLIKQLGLTINESLVLSETLSVQGTLYAAVYDTLAMNVTVELDGEYYETYVLNTPKFLPSMYSGFDFNSFAVYQGRAFGANDTGIFELTGATDAGATIRTGVVLHETDFDSPNQKRFRRAYLDISGTAPKMIVETEDGKRRVYDIDTKGKTVISHEMKGKYWTLSISDFQEIESVKLIPVVLSK